LLQKWAERFVVERKAYDQDVLAAILKWARNWFIEGPVQEYNITSLTGVKKIFKIRFLDPLLVHPAGFMNHSNPRRGATMRAHEKGVKEPILVHWAGILAGNKIPFARSTSLWYLNQAETRCEPIQKRFFDMWK
jgi:hypothetical protein